MLVDEAVEAYRSHATQRKRSPRGWMSGRTDRREKTGFCLRMRHRRTKIEVLTVSSTQARWESLSSFVSGDKSRIYLFRLIALAHFE